MSQEKAVPRAIGGALAVLQSHPHGFTDDASGAAVEAAAREVIRYHAPVGDQAERHARLAQAYESVISTLVACVPPGAERSTALQFLRSSKMWASAGVALEGA